MDIRKCRQCGRMYPFIRSPYCPECMEQIEEQYRTIRDFLEEDPTASISRISEKTEVPERVILYLIRAERLTLRNTSDQVTCERCHQPIESGRYCDACMVEMEKELARIAGRYDKTIGSDRNRSAERQKDESQNTERGGMHIQPKRRGL